MQNGYVKLHRKLLDSLIFSSEKGLKIWIWCLLKANHKENTFFLGRQKVHCNPGQFVMGSIKAKEELQLGISTLWYWLNILEREGLAVIKKTNKYSIITIKKWSDYQATENKWNTVEQTDGTQMETNKNDKNDKNILAKPRTEKDWANLRRKEIGKQPLTPRRMTDKQKGAMDAFKTGIEYFKQQGQEQHGMAFMEVDNEKRNGAVRKLVVRAHELIGDLKPLIDWWFQGAGEFANYEPEACFSGRIIERFKNKDKGKVNKKKKEWWEK